MYGPGSLVELPAGAIRSSPQAHVGLHRILGDAAWQRLPTAVRDRFGEPAKRVHYVGEFEVVRASRLGRVLAFLCRLIGTPVVARTGTRIPTVVHVGPAGNGVAWNREYRWPGERYCLVRSTKVIDSDGRLVERLPARLCMPLDVYECAGRLHFVSWGYYFDLGTWLLGRPLEVPLPSWLSPGVTHVEHRDESDGWFRSTMTVIHPCFGEMYYQSGRFHAAKEPA
jgi:hypothetical protein